PGAGFVSKAPKRVTITPGLVGSVANAGRSVNNESPFRSRPVVMLNGLPERAMMNGLKRMAFGPVIEPPSMNRWRLSNDDRAYSRARLYWSAGNVPAPSELLFA